MGPPSIPPGLPYTPFYCEENIYLLAQGFLRSASDISRSWELSVVFISNENKSVALWMQEGPALGTPQRLVVWDYHCILVMRPRMAARANSAWVFDYNSSLQMPCPWRKYIQETFKSNLCDLIPDEYRSVFRVIPAVDYIEQFASDRSHMMKPREPGGQIEYLHPPPEYEPIVGHVAQQNGFTNNMMTSFVNMRSTARMGHVLPDYEFWDWGSCGDDSR